MKCPRCAQEGLSFWQIFAFFNGRCQSCECTIELKSATPLYAFIAFAVVLYVLISYFIQDQALRLALFTVAGLIVSFGQMKFGKLHISEKNWEMDT